MPVRPLKSHINCQALVAECDKDFPDKPLKEAYGIVHGRLAILEGMDSTVLINPGWAGQIDDYGNCIMSPTQ